MECLVATEEIPFLELYDSQLDDKTSPRDLHLKKGIAAEMNLLEYYAKYINNKKRQEMMSTLTPPQFKEQTSYCRLAL